MQKFLVLSGMAFLCLVLAASQAHAQTQDTLKARAGDLPPRLLGRVQSKVDGAAHTLTRQTARYLERMEKRERQLEQQIARVDSAGAKQLFAASFRQYASLAQRIRTDTGNPGQGFNGVYQPWLDSLQGSIAFLVQNPAGARLQQLEGAAHGLQTLGAKYQDADLVKAYVRQREEQIGRYIGLHPDLQGQLGKSLAGMNRDIYYYSRQLREYREIWDSPDKMERQMLMLLNRLPAFQSFMKEHSLLGGLFNVPGNYDSPQALTGLQTKSQVARLIQQQVGTIDKTGAGPGMAALQANLQSAGSQLDLYKSKLDALGAGNGDGSLPDFTPNDQKTKTFWRRLEYGADFQTSRNNYYFPAVTDFGLSLGYRLGHDNVAGIGASYKLGWGNGIQHIAFTSEGIGLRSFLRIKIKGSFSAAGGFEYNYTTPFTSYQQIKQLQYWTKSGLIGVTKTISMKSKMFKRTTLSLLWDALSYQSVPHTQPFLFRIGYGW